MNANVGGRSANTAQIPGRIEIKVWHERVPPPEAQ